MAHASRPREFRAGFWKIHILHHAARRDVWGVWLLGELAEHGHALSPGTLYPVLAAMERNGWLRRTGPVGGGRARRTLRITAKGRRLLEQLRRDVQELHDEVVLGIEPAHGQGAGKGGASAARGRPTTSRHRRPSTAGARAR